jgi:hypothetical protein
MNKKKNKTWDLTGKAMETMGFVHALGYWDLLKYWAWKCK